MRRSLLLSLLIIVGACSELPKSDDPEILEGLPDMHSIADSLNRINAQSIKWSVDFKTDSILYAAQKKIDWKREFQAFLKDNVNRLRFKDAYHISDSVSGNTRFVSFKAQTNKQEVKSVEMRIQGGKLAFYKILKERNNLFSISRHTFLFDQAHYQLEIEQSIRGVFENKQFVYGNIMPAGGVWRGVLMMNNEKLPVSFSLNEDEMILKNGAERIIFEKPSSLNDSSVYHSAYFKSHFVFDVVDSTKIKGHWINEKHDETRIMGFEAIKDVAYRFKAHTLPNQNLSGEHGIFFYNEDDKIADSALMVLDQIHHLVHGSILTSTGDYRYLEGVIRNDSLLLSTMDGTHGYLFKGGIESDMIKGWFYAGQSWSQKWKANLNKPVKLTDPEQMTQIKEGERFSFSFPDKNGKIWSLDDPYFQGKVTLVSIMGTWCSNCLDETRFLKEIAESFPEEKIAIVALDFELVSDSAKAISNINRYVSNLDLNFPVLLAALNTSKEKATNALPSLNAIYSYPTLIILDQNHDAVRIHTGFSGPATGFNYYEVFKTRYYELVDSLITN
ncbi:MAG: TlpA disulfide reductase family protein [Salibacteraceae bacterium]